MFGDHQSTDDLFELVSRGGGSSMDQYHHGVSLSTEPPFEDEMAAWLYAGGEVEPVASMDQTACGDIVYGIAEDEKLVVASTNMAFKREAKCTENIGNDSSVRRKPAAMGGRRSNHLQTNNLTEKRRRWKINEKIKTLQQLVPGCDKCNQASILDQTIRYMKSLQQQIQAMAIGCSTRSASAAVYPIGQPMFPAPVAVTAGLPPPQTTIARGRMLRGLVATGGVFAPPTTTPMASFVPIFPLVRHPGVMMHVAPILPSPETVAIPNVASPPAQNQV